MVDCGVINVAVWRSACTSTKLYSVVKGQGFISPVDRPPTGPYAVPKRFSVVAEFYILKCCRESQRSDV